MNNYVVQREIFAVAKRAGKCLLFGIIGVLAVAVISLK
jgi:hypothetical protein